MAVWPMPAQPGDGSPQRARIENLTQTGAHRDEIAE